MTKEETEGIDVARPALTIITQVHIIMMFGTNFRQATVMMLHLHRISFIKIVRRQENKIVSSPSSVVAAFVFHFRCFSCTFRALFRVHFVSNDFLHAHEHSLSQH